MFSFGKGLTITKANLINEGVPCVNYGEVHSKFGFEVNPEIHALKYVSENYLKTDLNALLNKGDIVFADTSEDIEGSGNFTQLVSDEDVFAGYHTIIARPNDRQCSRFYAYLLDSLELRTQIRHAVKGVKVFSVTQAILRGINIWLPSLNEREKIANFLDHETAKIDTLIDKQQQLIKLLKEKRQAVISHAVTKGLNPEAQMRDSGVEWLGEVPEHWDVPQIGHCAFVTKLTGFEYTNLWEIEEAGEIIALRGFNVKERKLELNDVEKISAELSAKLVRSKLAKGDIVFPCTGTIGNAAMIEEDDIFHINQNIAKIRLDTTVSSRFAIYWLTSSFVRTLIDRNNTSGMQPVVLIGDIRKLPIPRFDYQEQECIADYLDSVVNKFNVVISNAATAIVLMQERRTALISTAVTGKIDVRHFASINGQTPTASSNQGAVND
jgi:type I restriction enzyme S subunit